MRRAQLATQDALLRRGAGAEEEHKALLALVLEQLAERKAAFLADAVQLGLGMHPGGDAAGKSETRADIASGS